jgi:hypothetical protein
MSLQDWLKKILGKAPLYPEKTPPEDIAVPNVVIQGSLHVDICSSASKKS